MANTVFNFQPNCLSILDEEATFPVHRIYCVGRNYAAHTLEMGGDPKKDAPFFFSKPADAACQLQQVPWPSRTNNLHHEVELVVAIGKAGSDLSLEQAADSVYAYGVGVDLTRRDLQKAAKDKGRPWDTAKGFDYSAPMGPLVLADKWQFDGNKSIRLSVNSEVRQEATLEQLIWNIPELIKELSTYYSLAPGDLIFTGTPAGVSALCKGDRITASVEGLPELEFTLES